MLSRNSVRSLQKASNRLLEALTVQGIARKLAPKEKQLTQATARFFVQQRIAFLKALEPQIEAFKESDIDALNIISLFDVATAQATNAYVPVLQTAIRVVTLLGGSDAVSAYKLGISFNQKNPLAIAFLKDRAAERVTLVNDETKAIIRGIVTSGADQGLSPQAIAKEIKERLTGFSHRPRAMASHIRTRAELVSITELAEGYQEGNYLAIKATGLDFEKAWLTVGDKRVSKGCETNQNEGWIGLDDEFPSGNVRAPRFPGCRCTIQYRPKE